MAVTLRDIAKALNLSHATVSFVLNDRRDVAIPESTRQRVLETAREMGYRPNRAARALVMGRTQMVAVWQPSPVAPPYGSVLGRLFTLLRERGYETMYCQSGETTEEQRVFEWPVDGVLGCDSGAFFDPNDQTLPQMPYVSFGSRCDVRTDHVRIDEYIGAYQAVRHLHEQGCRRIVHVTDQNHQGPRLDRSQAYVDLMEQSNLHVREVPVESDNRDNLVRAFEREMRLNGSIDGVFSYDDRLAMASYGALSAMNLSVPKDVAIVGFGNSAILGYFPVPISSVEMPWAEACNRAVTLLDERIKKPDMMKVREKLESRLIVRASSVRA